MILDESKVVDAIRSYLSQKGWTFKHPRRGEGEHGADITTAFHPIRRKAYIIEAKGELISHATQALHNSFPTVIGQILSRMDIEGNHNKRGRIYAIGIPKKWEGAYKKKILNMKFGWKLLKLKVFLVDAKGNVEEKPYTFFLKK